MNLNERYNIFLKSCVNEICHIIDNLIQGIPHFISHSIPRSGVQQFRSSAFRRSVFCRSVFCRSSVPHSEFCSAFICHFIYNANQGIHHFIPHSIHRSTVPCSTAPHFVLLFGKFDFSENSTHNKRH